MVGGQYSPQDFEVVRIGLHTVALWDALSRIKAHTEGLQAGLDMTLSNLRAAEARIAELEAGLREIADCHNGATMYRAEPPFHCKHLARRARSLLATTDSGGTPACPTCKSDSFHKLFHKSADTPSEEG